MKVEPWEVSCRDGEGKGLVSCSNPYTEGALKEKICQGEVKAGGSREGIMVFPRFFL